MSEKRRAPARAPGRREAFWLTFYASVAGGFVGTLIALIMVGITVWVMLELFM